MSAKQFEHTLTAEELYLRIIAPEFVNELLESRAAKLIQDNDTEAYTALKEIKQQKDQQFREVPATEKHAIQERHQQMSLEIQSTDFAAAVTRFSAEYDMPFDGRELDPIDAAEAYRRIQNEESKMLNLPPAQEPGPSIGDEVIPPEDMRFVVAKEIDAARERQRETTDPERNSFGEMSNAVRDEYIAEQKRIAEAALKAQEQSQQISQDRGNKLPDKDR